MFLWLPTIHCFPLPNNSLYYSLVKLISIPGTLTPSTSVMSPEGGLSWLLAMLFSLWVLAANVSARCKVDADVSGRLVATWTIHGVQDIKEALCQLCHCHRGVEAIFLAYAVHTLQFISFCMIPPSLSLSLSPLLSFCTIEQLLANKPLPQLNTCCRRPSCHQYSVESQSPWGQWGWCCLLGFVYLFAVHKCAYNISSNSVTHSHTFSSFLAC